MPGIFGIVNDTPRATLSAELAAMSRRLRHYPWYKENRHVDAAKRLALGRTSLGFVNTAEQPATNEDGSLLAVMEGEVYDYAEQRRILASAGHVFRGDSHAEVLLHGYEQNGPAFFRNLYGYFAAAIWDTRQRRLILTNDRFGMKPLYYTVLPGRLLFASEIKALLADPELSRTLDPRGIAQFFTFGQLLGEDTLLEAVRLVPAAGWLTYEVEKGRLNQDRYWRPQARRTNGSARMEAALLDEIDEAFGRAVERCTRGDEPLGLSLSGGLDARTILAAIDPQRAVTTVCLGIEGSLDHRCAEEMSRLTDRPHHRHILNTRFLARFEEYLQHDVQLTDGHYLCSVIVMPTLPLYHERGIRVLLRGHAGELLHMDKAYNFSLDPQAHALRDTDLEEWLLRRLKMYTYLEQAGGEALFAPPYRGQVEDLARASLLSCLNETAGIDPPVQRVSHLFLSQRLRRETALSMMEFGSLVETRLPYLDSDLVDLLLAAPPELKLGDKIQSHILRRRMPAFLNVVNANTGARMGAGPLTRAFTELRMRVLAKLGFKGYQPYERLGLWLREDLRLFVQQLLLSERFLGRGIFDPSGIRAVVEGHLNQGRNHTYLLLALMSFELGQRAFVDSEGCGAEGLPASERQGLSLAALSPLLESDLLD
jgi:asparagine synthase (glutamine-hydrolysing)